MLLVQIIFTYRIYSDDIMQTMPLQGKLNLNGGARNGGEISASKCVADV
jgi:hypothetical protein